MNEQISRGNAKPFFIIKGMLGTAPLILFVVLIPEFLNIFLNIGLENESIYVIASIIPLSLTAMPFALFRAKTRHVLLVTFIYIAGFLAFFSGTILQVTWNGNIPSAVVIASFLFSAGIVAYLFPLTMKQEFSRLATRPMSRVNVLFYILGMVMACGALSLIFTITRSYSWVLYVVGILFVLMPAGLKDLNELRLSEKLVLNGMNRMGYSLQFLGSFFGFFGAVFLFSAVLATANALSFAWTLLGVILGVLASIPMVKIKMLAAPFYLSLSFTIYVWFSGNLGLYSMPIPMILVGATTGLFLGDFQRLLSYFPVIKKAKLSGWFFLFLMGAIVASAVGNLYIVNVEDTPEIIDIGFIIFLLVAANGLICALLGNYFVNKARKMERTKEVLE